MRKKLFLMVFAFVAFLFVGAVNVNADTMIEDVNIIWENNPIAGQAPNLSNVSITGDVFNRRY